jgi:peptide deformylase
MVFKLGAHASLTQLSEEWIFTRDSDAKELEKSMIEFMIAENGIGLAANQIGLTKRVFVMGSYNIESFPKPFALFNPRILEVSKETSTFQEGCLSYPGLYLNIKRPARIIAEYQDSNANTHTVEMDGYVARCFQHELDHLNGVCFVDIASPLKLQLAMKKLRKQTK